MRRPGLVHALEQVRYGLLLGPASRLPGGPEGYASLVARLGVASDPARRRVAVERIRRWLAVSARDADLIFRGALRSEALEEIDFARRLRRPAELEQERFGVCGPRPEPGRPTVFVTLHFGSPVIAFLWLRRVAGIDVHVLGRPLDATNPMPGGRLDLGRRKVAWLERTAGSAMLGTDAPATLEARRILLEGGSLFAAGDVPGDVARRSTVVAPCGEGIHVAAGIHALARACNARVQGILARPSGRRGFTVELGRAVEASPDGEPPPQLVAEMGLVLRRRPELWWMWPYVNPAVLPPAAGIAAPGNAF